MWDFLADYHHFRHNAESVTDEAMEEIRAGVFKFRREAKSSDSWQVAYLRALAYAVLVWADDRWPANLRALERASRPYEELRVNPPANKTSGV